MPVTPDTSIQYLKGVGEKRAALYHKLRIETVGDLLYHFPRDYIDLSRPYEISTAPLQDPCPVKARIVSKSREQRIRAGLSIFKLEVEDDTGSMLVTLFNCKYTVEKLQLDSDYIFYGRVSGSFLRREMLSPVIYPVLAQTAILPVYPQTAGLNSTVMRKHITQALNELEELPDLIPANLRLAHHLQEITAALRSIHFPASLPEAQQARSRFIFEELLVLSCALSTLRSDNISLHAPPMTPADLTPFYRSLPFHPTRAQLRSIAEGVENMCSGTPMNRLVQGDVGSGKTLVAAALVYFSYLNGRQSAVMAPTSILAEQHYATFDRFLQGFGLRTALLTGSTKASEKREILQQLETGEIHLCIGTHALLTEGVSFAALGLVITDEQHRFGVAQRTKLSQKAENTHVLVMSATPIPRTLSLIIYGDLKLSIIDELPPERQPVDTLVIDSGKRERALGFIRNNLDKGKQAYIVCPLIEMGEIDTGLKPAVQYARSLKENSLKGYKVSLLHGKMKPREKEEIMRQFKAGDIQVLVSTTVVEVGVDVPNATIMLIENAERFGLSQLHQLRGRVGRGKDRSYCILVSDAKGEATRSRLKVMKEFSDGFQVAEYDMQLRGPGDFFGYRQHGLPELRVASLSDSLEVMQQAQECAHALLSEDPNLTKPEHLHLLKATNRMLQSVGKRPN